ncbi:Nascent polypeptide-associated complex subunit beta [Tulasnella sp. 330]|nr:Nascent polypeptide-associated complex subunit beta [Tulasnella sp. 330]KAG8870355.1 Nascent polypeptide-associated complex subunit beta [Tulasnella sp. 332]KAG8873045.1 Nascent polypeptide-associated complex subunit beta [Tulasnella sp. 331]
MDPEKLAKLKASGAGRLGGKGTPRRKVVKKAANSNTQDDKRLQGALKKLNMQPIANVEEVNMFQNDGNVLHFAAPKVHAALSANTMAVYGIGHVKELTELVPGILSQLGPDSLASLRKLAAQYQNDAAAGRHVAGANGGGAAAAADDDDDDVPDLVESFDVEEEKKEEPADESKLEELN